MLIHPVIRIVGFIVFAGFVALGDYGVLLAAAGVFVAVCLAVRRWPQRDAWQMVRRLRWLFASLMVVYLAFTPGQPLWGLSWMPSTEGVAQGLGRVAALLLLVVAANLLLTTTSRSQVLEALYWLARPLAWIGVSRERFAVRVTLAMEAITGVQAVVAGKLEHAGRSGKRLARLAEVMGEAYQATLARAERAELAPVEIGNGGAPPLYQWLAPLGLAAGFGWLL